MSRPRSPLAAFGYAVVVDVRLVVDVQIVFSSQVLANSALWSYNYERGGIWLA